MGIQAKSTDFKKFPLFSATEPTDMAHWVNYELLTWSGQDSAVQLVNLDNVMISDIVRKFGWQNINRFN